MMRISEVTIENYKVFNGEHKFKFETNLVYLVGENNSGKSTLFEAFSFLKSGIPDKRKLNDIKNKLAKDKENVSCTVKFTGDIADIITDFSEAKYKPYVFVENGKETLLVQRSSEERTITQNGKPKSLDIKTVTLWSEENGQFENPSGVDTVLGSLFESQFVWADTDPSDVSDFGSTKICGRLVVASMGDFFEGEQWKEFAKVHSETFHGSGDSLSKRTKEVEERIENILQAQYGEIGFAFNFQLPDAPTFYKTGRIRVNDGVETELNDKGTGLQRSVALAMIQVYAQNITNHPADSEKSKPLFFFIDEPEICLHPKAQTQLMKGLMDLSQIQQIFISTHSPYLLRTYNSTLHDLVIFEKSDSRVVVTTVDKMSLFDWSPSWGEINFVAYRLPTLEFHDELYGALHERFIAKASDEAEAKTRSNIENFDKEILSEGNSANQNMDWSKLKNGHQEPPRKVTPSTFIRNRMHHPESQQTRNFSEEDFEGSLQLMIRLLKAI